MKIQRIQVGTKEAGTLDKDISDYDNILATLYSHYDRMIKILGSTNLHYGPQ